MPRMPVTFRIVVCGIRAKSQRITGAPLVDVRAGDHAPTRQAFAPLAMLPSSQGAPHATAAEVGGGSRVRIALGSHGKSVAFCLVHRQGTPLRTASIPWVRSGCA